MLKLTRYGLHRMEGDIALLAQQDKVDHVMGTHLSIEAKVKVRRPCTHDINIHDVEIGADLFDDPLFKAMLPLPKERGEPTLVLEQTPDNLDLIIALGELSSPTNFAISSPFWLRTVPAYTMFLQDTNVQPLVLTDIPWERVKYAQQIADAAATSPRRLIMLAPKRMVLGANSFWVETRLRLCDLEGLELRRLGAGTLRTHMFET